VAVQQQRLNVRYSHGLQAFAAGGANATMSRAAERMTVASHRMRLFVLIAALLSGCSEVAPPPPPQPGGVPAAEPNTEPEGFPSLFTVTFTREYGLWKFRVCTLEIALFMNTNRASLECEPANGARVVAARELSVEQVTRLRELAKAADLYGPEHVGQDLTPGDGIFETLRIRPAGGGRAAVLVTSGNKSFLNSHARRDLLQLLGTIETELSTGVGLVTR